MKIFKVFLFAALIFAFSINLFAQTGANEPQKIKERAEKFLQSVRDEKWDETFKLVAIIVYSHSKITRKKFSLLSKRDDETKKEIAETFKGIYDSSKTGKIVSVRLNEKDKTFALIDFVNKNIDDFKMVFIDGEWFYAMEIYVD